MKSKIKFFKNYNFFLIVVFLFGIIFFVHTASSKKVQVAPEFYPSIPEFSSSILEADKYPKAFNPENGRLLFSVLNKDNNRLNLVDYEFLGNVSLSLDIFNTSPGKGLKSLINKVKVIKE